MGDGGKRHQTPLPLVKQKACQTPSPSREKENILKNQYIIAILPFKALARWTPATPLLFSICNAAVPILRNPRQAPAFERVASEIAPVREAAILATAFLQAPIGSGRKSMDNDDLEPRKPIAKPRDLDLLGVEELQDYLAELEAEAARVREKIKAKTDYRGAAEALFKT